MPDARRSVLCQSRAEEWANSLSHAVAAVFSAAALAVMLAQALPISGWHVAGVSVFGVSLVLLYAVSALYHGFTNHRMKRVFQVLDHALIFVLIAGSYTPWLLVNLRGPWGWSLLVVVWGTALSGIVFKAMFLPRFDKVGVAAYLVMGWIVCVALRPLLENVNPAGLAWLGAGGLCYTGGVAFYLLRGKRFSHLAWHFCVMAGSSCHVVAVFVGVLPARV